MKAWFNGKPILSRQITRRLDWDQETASVLFKKGVNRLMIRINNSEGSQTGFRLRITDQQGKPIRVDNRGSLQLR